MPRMVYTTKLCRPFLNAESGQAEEDAVDLESAVSD